MTQLQGIVNNTFLFFCNDCLLKKTLAFTETTNEQSSANYKSLVKKTEVAVFFWPAPNCQTIAANW